MKMKTTITVYANSPTEMRDLVEKHLDALVEYPATGMTKPGVFLERGQVGIEWTTEFNQLDEPEINWESANAEVSEESTLIDEIHMEDYR